MTHRALQLLHLPFSLPHRCRRHLPHGAGGRLALQLLVCCAQAVQLCPQHCDLLVSLTQLRHHTC
jgi:hypothetical protein